MSGRHQPLHGADSADALVVEPRTEAYRQGFADGEEWTERRLRTKGYMDAASWVRMTRPQCAACSLPAVKDGYCAGHARLGEYRVTDETHWAANE